MDINEFRKIERALSPSRAVLTFLFRPKAFKLLSLNHDFAASVLSEEHIRKAVLDGTLTGPDTHDRELVELRATELRKGLFYAAQVVIGSGILSALAGFALYSTLGLCPPWLSAVLQMLGVGVILWATLWELGWHVRSLGGHTLPERVHQWLFRTMYSVGSAFFFLAYAWATKW